MRKSNKIIGISLISFLLVFLIFIVIFRERDVEIGNNENSIKIELNNGKQNISQEEFNALLHNQSMNNTYTHDILIQTEISPTATKDPRILAIEQSLPRFEDYPAKTYSMPPKPKLIHESNPYGMKFWTLTESWVENATEYNMGGHYLMDRYGTGNPRVIIIDGLSGRVFHEYGSLYPHSVVNSSLVIFDPIDPECFTENGDYVPCYDYDNPRYAVWDGEKFISICKVEIKNWKLVSCGDVDKNFNILKKEILKQ